MNRIRFKSLLNKNHLLNCVVGAKLNNDTFEVTYASETQGYIILKVIDKSKADILLEPLADGAVVKLKYKKKNAV